MIIIRQGLGVAKVKAFYTLGNFLKKDFYSANLWELWYKTRLSCFGWKILTEVVTWFGCRPFETVGLWGFWRLNPKQETEML